MKMPSMVQMLSWAPLALIIVALIFGLIIDEIVAVLGLFAVALVIYYIVFLLAKADILFTLVESGWCKIVLHLGKYEREITPGLKWVGLPGIHSLYKRKMTFLKSTTDKEGRPVAEPHEDKDISSFKTTDYFYALPFKDEEDSHSLNLSGMLAVNGVISDYWKAFFVASDWYSTLNSEIMPQFRDVLVKVSYDDDIVGRDKDKEKVLPTLSDQLWDRLNFREGRNASILERLLNLYGIRIKSIQLRSIDPPPEWRATTLAPYKAKKEKEAAMEEAQASAARLDDTNQALNAWLRAHNATEDQINEKKEEFKALKEALRVWLEDNPHATQAEIDKKQKEVETLNIWLTDHFTVTEEQKLAKQNELHERVIIQAGGQQLHVKGLENASTAVVGGGGNAGLLVGNGGKGKPKQDKPGNGGSKPKKKKDEDDDDDDEDGGDEKWRRSTDK